MSPEVLGSHSDADDDSSILGSCEVWTGKQSPTFRRCYSRHLRNSTDPRTVWTYTYNSRRDNQYMTDDINRSTASTLYTFTYKTQTFKLSRGLI